MATPLVARYARLVDEMKGKAPEAEGDDEEDGTKALRAQHRCDAANVAMTNVQSSGTNEQDTHAETGYGVADILATVTTPCSVHNGYERWSEWLFRLESSWYIGVTWRHDTCTGQRSH